MPKQCKCIECDKKAKWAIYYRDGEIDIGYNIFCFKHTIKEMKNGRDGYKVGIVKRLRKNT